MAINTILLDFSVIPSNISNSEERQALQSAVESVLTEYIPSLKLKHSVELDGGFLVLYTGERETLVTLRAFERGLVSCTIEYYKEENEKPLLSFESTRKLERDIREKSHGKKSHSLPSLKRGGIIERYFPTADERILEYDIDKVLYNEKSKYQKILIVHSRSLGNLLVLDDLQNMSESDLIYTETLMQRGKENYQDKEIVILGGGDGALLWELLKEKPKFVTMIEIDEQVMEACRKYLRSCCGTCLDNYNGENYQIIVDDCVKTLKKMIEDGRKFDYVFGDLTDIPLSASPQGEIWDFIRLILDLSFSVLKPTGKYMTHGNGASCPESLKMYESQLQKLNTPVEFSRDHAFVPSFMEDWIFYQVWPLQQ
ncbi:spermine synthase [Anabrus simplex]|uniref:spermine synthase n=1 Tax=Anabrus simplex TaxID=316456 RepID=UPI0035A36AB1